MDDGGVEQIRRFNRTVTRRVGALSDRFLARDRPLGASRLLWEIGADGCEVRAIRARLDLDSGQLSRLLRGLEDDGLVRVEPDPSDRRVRVARLTRTGRSELRLLDRRSDDLARSMLEPLDPDRREQLVSAMATVERLLTRSMGALRPTDPAHPDARRCVAAYFAELDRRSDSGFDPSAGIPAARHERRDPRRAPRARPAGGGVPGRLPARRAGRLRRRQAPAGPGGRDQAHVGRRERPRAGTRPPPARRARGPGGPQRGDGRPPGDQPRPRRGDRHVPLGRLRRGARLQRRAVRPPLVREAAQRAASRWWTRRTAIAPSPTADATRLIEPECTSPTAKMPGWLVSRKWGRSSP